MLKKVLIADRGEVALRVIRACHELEIETVAVFSEADRDAFHALAAREAVCIGPAPIAKSYLNIPRIISAAELTGVDAIHPGYGFLAANARFAEICELCGFTFIGPSSTALKRIADQGGVRKVLLEAGIPLLPEGWEEINQPVDEKHPREFRQIEVQIMGDSYGRAIHLGERSYLGQGRRRKLLAEAPARDLPPRLREQMGKAAVKAAQGLGYANIGTVRFLVDKRGRFYFLDLDPRLQVEHPLTEMVTGVDLVKEQICLAAGEPLGYVQEDVTLRGWAMAGRIKAEDPAAGFRPSPGLVQVYHPPGGPGVRVDISLYQGCPVPPDYDSLLGKLTAWGTGREEAAARLKCALGEFVIEGIHTTLPYLLQVMADEQRRCEERKPAPALPAGSILKLA